MDIMNRNHRRAVSYKHLLLKQKTVNARLSVLRIYNFSKQEDVGFVGFIMLAKDHEYKFFQFIHTKLYKIV
jgi:hypothetical protein